jgi:hypothetical protein
MTGVFSQDDTAERFRRRIERKDRAIGNQRIGDLTKLFAYRYGGTREGWQFPDDDSGREDLDILLHHYALNNPHKMLKIIKLRAPWMTEAEALSLIEAVPRRWRADTLGRLLNFTGEQWLRLRLRTISPVDMTKKQRRKHSQQRHRERMRIKRRRAGKLPREEWLAKNNISRTKPWEAEGICRRTWERRRAKTAATQPVSQVCSNKVYISGRHTCDIGASVEAAKRVGEQGPRQAASAKSVVLTSEPSLKVSAMPASPDLSHLKKGAA